MQQVPTLLRLLGHLAPRLEGPMRRMLHSLQGELSQGIQRHHWRSRALPLLNLRPCQRMRQVALEPHLQGHSTTMGPDVEMGTIEAAAPPEAASNDLDLRASASFKFAAQGGIMPPRDASHRWPGAAQ